MDRLYAQGKQWVPQSDLMRLREHLTVTLVGGIIPDNLRNDIETALKETDPDTFTRPGRIIGGDLTGI